MLSLSLYFFPLDALDLGIIPPPLAAFVFPGLQAVLQFKIERIFCLGHAGLDPISAQIGI